MTDRKQEFHDVVERLIPFGEDAKELHFWEAIFDDLTEEDQDSVMENLKKELALLEKKS